MVRGSSQFGKEGEEAATVFLKKKGYRILQKNFRCKAGEIDIIAEHQKVVVFVEVKTRSSYHFGPPIIALTPKKQQKLATIARNFIAKHKMTQRQCRFDVVSITGQPDRRDPWKIELLQDAFRVGI